MPLRKESLSRKNCNLAFEQAMTRNIAIRNATLSNISDVPIVAMLLGTKSGIVERRKRYFADDRVARQRLCHL